MQIVFVEDVRDDVDLVRGTLNGAGIQAVVTQVDSLPALESALSRQSFQLALVDFVLPRFGGLEAVAVIRQRAPGLPIVLLTGALDESTAGAVARVDAYLVKDRLAELPRLVTTLTSGASSARPVAVVDSPEADR